MDEHNESELEPQAPAALVRRLRSLHNCPVLIPPQVDEAVLASARQHLSASLKTRRWVRVSRWLSAAATVTLGLFVSSLWFGRHGHPPAVAREDIDRNGRIDILDAFALARRIDRGDASVPQFDINRDGVVDRRDIDAIAAEAVKLDKRKG